MKSIAVNTAPNRPQMRPKSEPRARDGQPEMTPTNGSRAPTGEPNPPQHRKPLTDRETALVIAWARLRAEGNENRAEAARRAGYKGRLDTLSKQAARVLAKPQAKAMVDELMKEALAVPTSMTLTPPRRFRYIMTMNEVLATTTFLARATLDDVLDVEGKFDIEKARKTGGIHALKRVKSRTSRRYHKDGTFDETVTHEVELRDKNGSLELMGRHFQLWEEEEDLERAGQRLLQIEAEARRDLEVYGK